MDTLLTSIPINSLIIIPDKNRLQYINIVFTLPKKVQDILFSVDTGSFIRGIARSYDISEEAQPSIAFAILEIAIGKKTFGQLPAVFSSELGLEPVQAQRMAAEIEKDIFGPAKAELDAFLSDKTTSTLRIAPLAQSKPGNLLDLKEIVAAKKQEQLSGRPRTPLLTKERSGEVSKPQAPRPPISPRTQLPLPPKPPVTPIDFSKY